MSYVKTLVDSKGKQKIVEELREMLTTQRDWSPNNYLTHITEPYFFFWTHKVPVYNFQHRYLFSYLGKHRPYPNAVGHALIELNRLVSGDGPFELMLSPEMAILYTEIQGGGNV